MGTPDERRWYRMDQVWATVIAGIGSATIAGVIGIISSSVSYRTSSRQLNAQLVENERNRKHQILIAIGAKKREALESLWRLLFILERMGHLDDADLDLYIRGLLWLSVDLRKDCLSLIRDAQHVTSNEQQQARRSLITTIRESILREANEIE
jgi:hypothetical protein